MFKDYTRPVYRIRIAAERAGISTQLLRAWERRYALLTPREAIADIACILMRTLPCCAVQRSCLTPPSHEAPLFPNQDSLPVCDSNARAITLQQPLDDGNEDAGQHEVERKRQRRHHDHGAAHAVPQG